MTTVFSPNDVSRPQEPESVSGQADTPGVSGEELVRRAKARYAHRPWFGQGGALKDQSANWVRQAYRDCGMTLPSTKHPNDYHLIPKGEGISPSHPDSLAGNEIGPSITRGRLKPGDLVFFANTTPGDPPGVVTHVGIYAGHGMMLDRGTFQNLVQLRSLDTFRHFVEGRRPKVLRQSDDLLRTSIELQGGKAAAKLNGKHTENLILAASSSGEILVNHELANPTYLTVEINAGAGWHKGYMRHGTCRFIDLDSCEVMFRNGALMAQINGQDITPIHVKFELMTAAAMLGVSQSAALHSASRLPL